MIYPRHIVAVAGLVWNAKQQVLLVGRSGGSWELPGGEVAVGEDVISALKREVYTSTGYRVSVAKLACVESNVGFPPKLLMTFSCGLEGGSLCPGPHGAVWVSEAEALTLIQDGAQLDKLIDGLSRHGVTYRKYVTGPYRVQLEALI